MQATIAGVSSFIVLSLLGVPFAGPLALVVFFFDLIPVVGATIAAILVAIVAALVNFPVALIIWVIFAIVYQQVENYLIQPQIQKRATEIEPSSSSSRSSSAPPCSGCSGGARIPTAASIRSPCTSGASTAPRSGPRKSSVRSESHVNGRLQAEAPPKPKPAT